MRIDEQEASGQSMGSRVIFGAPERLFRLQPLVFQADGLVSSSMPMGPWLSHGSGPGSRPLAGAAGVLVDDVLGYAINAMTPSWSVTTDIAVDFLADLPTGGRLHAEARVVHRDDRGGVAQGRLLTDDGAVVALCRERCRWVTESPFDQVLSSRRIETDDDIGGSSLRDLLGPGVAWEDGGLRAVVDARLGNPLGNLHGGISVCLADLVAATTVPEPGRTASVRVQYVRGLAAAEVALLEATVAHRGRTLAIVDVVARDASGRSCTLATVTRHC